MDMTCRKTRLCGAAGVVVLVLSGGVARALAQGAPAAGAVAAGGDLEQAERLLQQGKVLEAADAFQRANEQAGGRCASCLLGLARSLSHIEVPESLERAIAATREAIDLLGRRDPLLGRAHFQLGDLLLMGSGAEALAEAEAAYADAAGVGDDYRARALASLAVVRVRRKHYAEAVEAAKQAIDIDPAGQAGGQARSAICRARSERYPAPMPPFPGSLAKTRPAGEAPDSGEPLRLQGEVQRPRAVYSAPPVYTEAARKARLQGVVIVEAVIDESGCVVEAKILKGMPMGLDRAAIEAIRSWVFEPATLEGNPVKVYYTLTVNFQVQ